METLPVGSRTSKAKADRPEGRNPVWNRDEAILLLDLYLRVGRAPSDDLQVRRLSEDLRAIAQRHGTMVTTTYRNAKGVAMKLKAMAQRDPAFRALGQKGLRAVSIDAEVWRDLATAPIKLAREVDRILTASPVPLSIRSPLARTQGPVPSFGSVTAERLDSECVVYVLRFHGPLGSLFASGQIPEGSIIAKLGRSNDPMRRVSELGAGFPPGARLGWTIIATVEFPTGNAAHTAEQALLVSSELKGWTLGGEFVVAPEKTLLADLQALADSCDATPK